MIIGGGDTLNRAEASALHVALDCEDDYDGETIDELDDDTESVTKYHDVSYESIDFEGNADHVDDYLTGESTSLEVKDYLQKTTMNEFPQVMAELITFAFTQRNTANNAGKLNEKTFLAKNILITKKQFSVFFYDTKNDKMLQSGFYKLKSNGAMVLLGILLNFHLFVKCVDLSKCQKSRFQLMMNDLGCLNGYYHISEYREYIKHARPQTKKIDYGTSPKKRKEDEKEEYT